MNRFFFGLLAITLVYGFTLLSGEIIIGVAYTAPFSGWSYGAFMARLQPLLLVALLFFVSFLYAKQEKNVKQLTFATPINPRTYALVKCAAMAAGYAAIAVAVVLVSFIFYGIVFRFYGFGDFVAPMLLTLIPAMLFVLGLGMVAGGIHPGLIYVAMAGMFAVDMLPIHMFLNISGGRFFTVYPLTLPLGAGGEPYFYVPLGFFLGRLLLSGLGIFMTCIGLKGYTKT